VASVVLGISTEMTIEDTIRKAIGKGYRHYSCDAYLDKNWVCIPDNYCQIFLDPLFWQALSQALNWVACREAGLAPNDWLANWHRFVNHLADGRDVESFFESLA
jgi:hypothetical protein